MHEQDPEASERRVFDTAADLVAELPRDESLPSAREALEFIASAADRALFLDYDGTISPIAAVPSLAVLDAAMRQAIVAIAAFAEVTIVSGRDLEDVIGRVGIPGIAYSGSHGFELQYVDGTRTMLGRGGDFVESLAIGTRQLNERLSAQVGVIIEVKRLATAVHYRLSPPELEPLIGATVLEVAEQTPGLRLGHGKKLFELLPDIDWHKGQLVRQLTRDGHRVRPLALPRTAIYIGDDVTDEDGFAAVQDGGVGIVVGTRGAIASTAARYRLDDVNDVRLWLTELEALLRARRSRPGS